MLISKIFKSYPQNFKNYYYLCTVFNEKKPLVLAVYIHPARMVEIILKTIESLL
jgi:hypothetical protein